MARYGIVPRSEPINAVIFQGTPSQLISLPAFIKGAVAILAIGIGFGYASSQWPVPWFIPVLAVLLVLGGIGLAYLQVKFTEFEIDVERITCRKGILIERCRASSCSGFRM
jgi:protein-S-isoprenylcysteine O-methyltransferase Ste14